MIPWFIVYLAVSICDIADIAHESKETDGLERRNIPSKLAPTQVNLMNFLGPHDFEVRSHQTDPSNKGDGASQGGRGTGQGG